MQEYITELCPHCEEEITLTWDVENDGYQIYCPNCGKVIMLCSMCDRSPCNWTENGCKHSDERYRRNNDGWIPVEEALPPNVKRGFYPKYQVTTKHGVTEGWYDQYKEGWYVLTWFREFDGEVDFDKGNVLKISFLTDEANRKQNILTAWQYLPRPYEPGRRDAVERESNNL